jgi:hypothetical protein
MPHAANHDVGFSPYRPSKGLKPDIYRDLAGTTKVVP